jgi:hypothetical protein
VAIISKTLNINKAAEFLNIPKITIFKHLESVEKKLGEKIFNRTPKVSNVVLTQYGKNIIPKIQNILWIVSSLSPSEGLNSSAPNKGKIAITSTQSLLEAFIVPFTRNLLKDNPDIELTINQRDENYYSNPVLNEIFIGCWENNPTYEYIPFYTFRQKLWASKDYLKETAPIKDLKDIKEHFFIGLKSINDIEHIISHDKLLKQLGSDKGNLRFIDVAGPRISDALALNSVGIISSAPEIKRLLGYDLEPVCPDFSGDEIDIYVTVNKQFIKWPICKFILNWIFDCRDNSLRKIGVTPPQRYPIDEIKA